MGTDFLFWTPIFYDWIIKDNERLNDQRVPETIKG